MRRGQAIRRKIAKQRNEVLRIISLITALIDRRKENLRYAVEEIWLK
jgi:hypothetical protein